jgi:outer membrane lipoprotein carrier protein
VARATATSPPSPASPRPGAAAPAEAVAAARALERRLAEVTALVAQFTQVVESPALPTAQTESGTLYLARPGRMRWEYSTPAGKLAIADGHRTWLYLPEDRQALSAPLGGPGQDQGIGLLLGGTTDILAVFAPRLVPGRESGGPTLLALRPLSPDAPYDEVRVETGAGGFPRTLIVNDPLGGRVTYRFEAIRFVPALDEALFRFTPPPGVSVQEAGP